MASHAAAEAARTLHGQAVEKIAYKEQARNCAARGQPIPEPPPKVKWEETFQRAMGSMMNSATSSTTTSTNHSSSTTTNRDSSSVPPSQQRSSQHRPAWQNKFQSAVDAVKTKAATAAAMHMADTFIQKAGQKIKKGAR